MSGFSNELIQCANELLITVGGDANEDLPVVRNWEWLFWLVYDLVEVDRQGIVIPTKRGHHLVLHFFALEKDSTTKSRTNV